MYIRFVVLDRKAKFRLNILMDKPSMESSNARPVTVEDKERKIKFVNLHFANSSGYGNIERVFIHDITVCEETPDVIPLHIEEKGRLISIDQGIEGTMLNLHVNREQTKKKSKYEMDDDEVEEEEKEKFRLENKLTVRTGKTGYSSSYSTEGQMVDVSSIQKWAEENMDDIRTEGKEYKIEEQADEETGKTVKVDNRPQFTVTQFQGTLHTQTIPSHLQQQAKLDGDVFLSKEDKLGEVLGSLTKLSGLVSKKTGKMDTGWEPKTLVASTYNELFEKALIKMQIRSHRNNGSTDPNNHLEGIEKKIAEIGKKMTNSIKTYVLDEQFADSTRLIISVFNISDRSPYNQDCESNIVEMARLVVNTKDGGVTLHALDSKIMKHLFEDYDNSKLKAYFTMEK